MNPIEALSTEVWDFIRAPDPAAQRVGVFLLAYVFLAAAAGKLKAIDAFGRALVDFGLVRRASRRAALAIALLEAGIALFILIPATAQFGSAAAVLLLMGFTVLIARSVLRGDSFACNCFGADGSMISMRTVARNVVLLTGASIVAVWTAQRTPSYTPGLDAIAAACVALAIVGIVVLALHLPALARLNAGWARGYRAAVLGRE